MGDIYSGDIISAAKLAGLPAESQKRFVEIKRDLTLLETSKRQIELYAPCFCGSGKKFKFCCHASAKVERPNAQAHRPEAAE